MTTINYQGTEIKITSKYQGVAKPWDGKYEKKHYSVFVTIDDKSIQFEYYCNDAELKRNELIEALNCFVLDVIAYRNAKDKYDFADEFGYDRYKDRKLLSDAWYGCMSASEKWEKIGDIDVYEFSNWLSEEFNV